MTKRSGRAPRTRRAVLEDTGPLPVRPEYELRAIFEASPECIKLLDRRGRLVDMNPAGLTMLEADSPDQVRSGEFSTFVAPEYRGAWADMLRRVFAGMTVSLEFEVIGLAGTRRWLETRAVPLRDDDGTVSLLLGLTRDTTARRAAEVAIRESEESFRSIVDQATDPMYVLQGDRFVHVNHAWEHLLGYSAAEAAAPGFTFWHVIAPDSEPLVRDRIRRIAGGFPVERRFEMGGLCRDGRRLDLEVSVADTQWRGAPAIHGVYHDVTEHRRTERIQRAAYRISEAAHTATGLSGLFAEVHRIVGELMEARNFYVALYDASRDELSFPYFVDEHDAPAGSKPLGRGLTDHVIRSGQPILATPERAAELERLGEIERIGTPSVDWLGVPLTTGERTIGALVAQSYTDGVRYRQADMDLLLFVSRQVAMAIERRRAEDAVRQSEASYRTLVEQAIHGIFRETEDGRLLAANRALAGMLGYDDPAQLLELRTDRDLYYAPGERSDVLAQIRDRDGASVETRWRRRDGRDVTVRLSGRPVRGPDGTIASYEFLAEDVTTERMLEAQLRQSQRLEAVGRLAGGIAHDFNNLLTAILGSAEMLLGTLEADHPGREDAEEVRHSALRAADLTGQLLAFSRRQVLQPTVVDLGIIVAGMERLARRLIGEHIALRTRLAPGLHHVRVDQGQIEQVLVNLVVNARDAMPDGGTITIETSNVELDEGTTQEFSTVSAGEYAMVAIRDTGAGMDAATQARIFEPFFTTKERGKGTGLGLATAYGIVKQSGGFVAVESAPGRGTTFRVYLPRADAGPGPAAADTHPTDRGTETVLVVEDEAAVRRLTERTLRALGYTVLEAASGGAALEVAEAHPGRIALLVCDVVMPGLSGPETATRLLARRPDMKVLFVSGYPADALETYRMGSGGADLLPKPFTTEALGRRVRQALDAPAV